MNVRATVDHVLAAARVREVAAPTTSTRNRPTLGFRGPSLVLPSEIRA